MFRLKSFNDSLGFAAGMKKLVEEEMLEHSTISPELTIYVAKDSDILKQQRKALEARVLTTGARKKGQ